MGKNKGVSLPATPTYQSDPTFKSGLDSMMKLGGRLTAGDFTGDLSWLSDTTTVNPDIIKGFFTGLQPSFQKMRQDTINTLAANNQLESSTTANALTQLDQNMADTMTGQVANLQTQALQNRLNLFGTGLNTISGATGMAQSDQNSLNDFNLKNYENLVTKALAEKKPEKGGWTGALTGAAGGAMAGAAFGPIGMLVGAGVGGLAGGLGPQGTGGSILSSGSGSMGGGGLTNRLSGTYNNPYRSIAGSSATNDLSMRGGYNNMFGYGLN